MAAGLVEPYVPTLGGKPYRGSKPGKTGADNMRGT
jgi:hypothetical protein